jgi:catechol 2,3-dioxygenase-like lactoylglutathione lyase family enzyme
MTKADPIIAVKDIEASAALYQAVLGCRSMHGGKAFDILVDEQEEVLLCLHPPEAHGHPTMIDPGIAPGNGLILYFRTDNLDAIRKNAEGLNAHVEEEMHLNPNALRREFSLRDPDGYYLTITEFHRYEG